MAGLVTKWGLLDALRQWTFAMEARAYLLRLYQNNWVPTITDTLANYVECTFDGYAPRPLSPAFTPIWNAGSQLYTLQFPVVSWSGTGIVSQPVYGWWISNPSQGVMIASTVSDRPQMMGAIGTYLTILPGIVAGD